MPQSQIIQSRPSIITAAAGNGRADFTRLSRFAPGTPPPGLGTSGDVFKLLYGDTGRIGLYNQKIIQPDYCEPNWGPALQIDKVANHYGLITPFPDQAEQTLMLGFRRPPIVGETGVGNLCFMGTETPTTAAGGSIFFYSTTNPAGVKVGSRGIAAVETFDISAVPVGSYLLLIVSFSAAANQRIAYMPGFTPVVRAGTVQVSTGPLNWSLQERWFSNGYGRPFEACLCAWFPTPRADTAGCDTLRDYAKGLMAPEGISFWGVP